MTLTPADRHDIRRDRHKHDMFNHVVNQDLREELDEETAVWLRSEPIVIDWLRELQAIEESIDHQIAQHRLHLSQSANHPTKNPGGLTGFPSKEYRKERQAFEEWLARVMRLKRAIKERKAEAKVLIAYYGLVPDQAEWTVILVTLNRLLEQEDVAGATRVVATALRFHKAQEGR